MWTKASIPDGRHVVGSRLCQLNNLLELLDRLARVAMLFFIDTDVEVGKRKKRVHGRRSPEMRDGGFAISACRSRVSPIMFSAIALLLTTSARMRP